MTRRDMPWAKIAAVAAVLFPALFFFGTASLNVPQGASDQKVIDWWADSSNRTITILSMYSFILAALVFLVLLAYLRTRMGSKDRETELLSTIMFSSGVVFAALLAAAGGARGLVAAAVEYNDESLPGVDTLRYISFSSYGFMMAGLLAAALTILATSVLILRSDVFGRWLGWLGLVAAALIVVVTLGLGRPFAIPVVLIWSLATSVALWRDRDGLNATTT